MKPFTAVLTTVALLFATGCGGDDDGDGPTGPTGIITGDPLFSWTESDIQFSGYDIWIGAQGDEGAIDFGCSLGTEDGLWIMLPEGAVGTWQLSQPGVEVILNLDTCVYEGGPDHQGSSGWVEVERVSTWGQATVGIEGRFEFTLVPTSDQCEYWGESKTLVNGRFRVPTNQEE